MLKPLSSSVLYKKTLLDARHYPSPREVGVYQPITDKGKNTLESSSRALSNNLQDHFSLIYCLRLIHIDKSEIETDVSIEV